MAEQKYEMLRQKVNETFNPEIDAKVELKCQILETLLKLKKHKWVFLNHTKAERYSQQQIQILVPKEFDIVKLGEEIASENPTLESYRNSYGDTVIRVKNQ